MTEALWISNGVLWMLVVVLSGAVLALTRQVGVLHERIQPVGALALSTGPRVGEPAPEVAVTSLDGRLSRIGGHSPEPGLRLLFFLSPSCPVCRTLLPTVLRVAQRESATVLYASDGAEADHAGYARDHGIDPSDYFVSQELGLRYSVAKLPYAVLIDARGRVRAQGIVNQREHLESLFEADTLGVGSLQEYLSERTDLPVVEGGHA